MNPSWKLGTITCAWLLFTSNQNNSPER